MSSPSEVTRGVPPPRRQAPAPNSRQPPPPPPSPAAAPHNRRQRVSSSFLPLSLPPLLLSPLPVAMQLLPDADPAVTHAHVVCGDEFSVGYGDGFRVDPAAAVAPRSARVGGSLDPVALGADPNVSRADLAAAVATVRAGAVGPCCLDDNDSCSPSSSSDGGALSGVRFPGRWLPLPTRSVQLVSTDGDNVDLLDRWWPRPWRGAALLQPSCSVVGAPVCPSVQLPAPLA